MEKWIILTAISKEWFKGGLNPITSSVEDIAVCDEDGDLIFFDSLDEASAYQERYCISGRCVELALI